jgi:ElaB/YqjD/DUF883 family membrane-anchored ribosome-binding protein
MYGQAAIRNPTSRVAELMKNLRDLEVRVLRLNPRDAAWASADVTDSVGTALEDIADRFRSGVGYAAKEGAHLAHRANAAGRGSYAFLKSEVDAHPLVVLGVAAGIGILIGTSLYRRSRNAPPEPKPRRRTNRRVRK